VEGYRSFSLLAATTVNANFPFYLQSSFCCTPTSQSYRRFNHSAKDRNFAEVYAIAHAYHQNLNSQLPFGDQDQEACGWCGLVSHDNPFSRSVLKMGMEPFGLG
jgi:hypothetical protein